MTKKIKKIIFIETSPPNVHVFSKVPLPRLGTILLGTKLKEAGYDVKSYVEELHDLDLKDVLSADAVGISTITSTSKRSYEIADMLRSVGMRVFMGGPHVTFMPDEALEHCDYVVRGEGDDNILDFVKALEANKGFEKIDGLSYRRDGKIFHNKTTSFCKNLDTLPIPDYTIVKGLEVNAHKKFPITPIMTSRGCPYDCSFCSVTEMFGRKYRFRSKELVLEELRINKENGGKWVFFYDDNFIANRKRTKELLSLMIEKKITPKWTAQVRVEVAKDPELLDLMKRSGCHTVYIGFESINPATLELYNKSQSVEDIENCIKILHDNGIRIHGMFVFGSDHDTVDTIRKTMLFAKKNELQSIQFLMLTPLPGTKLYFDLDKEKRIINKDWSLYDAHHVVFTPKHMTYYQIQTETMRATKEFYSLGQIFKAVGKFDLFNIAVKIYGYKLTRQWFRTHKYFVEYTEKITSAGKVIELAARKTAEDLKEKFRELEIAGTLPSAGKHRV
jgi:radical SAM superfamily enzyme YgiQ (UPF0313 family)